MEQLKTSQREPEPQQDSEWQTVEQYAARRDRARNGKIVMKAKDLPWVASSMGFFKHYFRGRQNDGSAMADWTCFIHDVKVHSGKHRHQGGLLIFVLEGEGYTMIDDQKVEWEKGDLILLPVKPDGCAHQHFNKVPGTPAKWIAFIYEPFFGTLGNEYEHTEDAANWKKA